MSNPNLPISGKYNTYIGARYVPLMGGEWNQDKAYEPLVIVTYQGNSYTSNTFVPAGTDINDKTYWTKTGNYNAQVDQYRNEVEKALKEINQINSNVNEVYTEIMTVQPEINNTAQNAINAINNTKNDAITSIDDKVSNANQSIENKINQANTQIDNKVISAKSQINQAADTASSNINNLSTSATSDLTELKESIAADLNSQHDELNSQLTETYNTGTTQINQAVQDALDNINDAVPNPYFIRPLQNVNCHILFACSDSSNMGKNLNGNGGFNMATIHHDLSTLQSEENPVCVHIVLGEVSSETVNLISQYMLQHPDTLFTISGWCEENTNYPLSAFQQTLEYLHNLSSVSAHIWTLTHAQLFQRDLYNSTNSFMSRIYATLKYGVCMNWSMSVEFSSNDLNISNIRFVANEESIRASVISNTTPPITIHDTVAIANQTHTFVYQHSYPFKTQVFPEFPENYVINSLSNGREYDENIGYMTMSISQAGSTTDLNLYYTQFTHNISGNTAPNSYEVILRSRHGFFETSYNRQHIHKAVGRI